MDSKRRRVLKKVMRRWCQEDRAVRALTAVDREAFLDVLLPEEAADVDAVYWDEWAVQSAHDAAVWRTEQLAIIRRCAEEQLVLSKPVLTMAEAARLLGVSAKRLQNIIYEEKKAEGGKMPDFVCDARGRLSRRILREPLLKWVARSTKVAPPKRRRGRPSKAE